MKIITAVDHEIRALWGNGKGVTLITIATGFGLLVGTRMIYPVIIPNLQDTYGLNLTVAGLLVSILWVTYAIGHFPSGVLADRYNERTIMISSMFIVAVALGFVITASTPLVLFIATAIVGLGSSLYPIARITFLSNIYPERLGSALGITLAAADIGQTVLPPIAAVLTLVIAWQIGLGFVIPVLVLSGVIIYIFAPNPETTMSATDTTGIRDILAVLGEFRTHAMRNVIIIMFLYFFIWQSFTAFYPTYLVTIKGFSPTIASILFGVFFASGVILKPISGGIYDRMGIRLALIGILTPPVAGFLFLPVIDNILLLAVVTALISSMLGSGVVTESYLAESLSEEVQGTGLGAVKSLTATFAAGGPVLFGVIADNGYLEEGYILLAVIMAAAIALTLRM